MRFTWLYAIAFVVCCHGLAAAQHNVLVLKDDRNDPCSRFKMRILEPTDDKDNYKLRVRKPSADIDPQMIWNPCPRNEPQVARLIVPFVPDYRGKFLVPPSLLTPSSPLMLTEQQDRLKQIRPLMPPAMEMMRGRK